VLYNVVANKKNKPKEYAALVMYAKHCQHPLPVNLTPSPWKPIFFTLPCHRMLFLTSHMYRRWSMGTMVPHFACPLSSLH